MNSFVLDFDKSMGEIGLTDVDEDKDWISEVMLRFFLFGMYRTTM